MVMQSEKTALVQGIHIETAAPDQGFTNPSIHITTKEETFIERLDGMLWWLRKAGLIQDFDLRSAEVKTLAGWTNTFSWVASGSPVTDPDVIEAWVQEQLERRALIRAEVRELMYGD